MKKFSYLLAICIVASLALHGRGGGGFYKEIDSKEKCPFPVDITISHEGSGELRVKLVFGDMSGGYSPAETNLLLKRGNSYRTIDLNPQFLPGWDHTIENGVSVPKRVPEKDKNAYGENEFSFTLSRDDLAEARVSVLFSYKGRRDIGYTNITPYRLKIIDTEPAGSGQPR